MADGITVDANGKASTIKDPNEVLDYLFDFSLYLANPVDTISSATALTDSVSLVVDSTSNTSDSVTVWVSGGEEGKTHRLTCRIVTAAGRTVDRSLYFKMKAR